MSEKTYFADPRRAKYEDFRNLQKIAIHDPLIQVILDSLGGYVLILNEERQVLTANPEFNNFLCGEKTAEFKGDRPGEILNCIHYQEGPSGCGTSKACRNCGAVLAILKSQQKKEAHHEECHLSMDKGGKIEALEFEVKCTPLEINETNLTVFVLNNISSAKRKEVLEKIFFHDVRNIICAIMGYSEILSLNNDSDEMGATIYTLVKHLNEEIVTQEKLQDAENGTLNLTAENLIPKKLFESIVKYYSGHQLMNGKKIVIDIPPDLPTIKSDFILIKRILLNMFKNALEASPSESTIILKVSDSDGNACFSVNNPGYIPEELHTRVFERSFSTKAKTGRGIGTYSMKLLGENYLGGKVDFTSDPERGTTFYLCIPYRINDNTPIYPPHH